MAPLSRGVGAHPVQESEASTMNSDRKADLRTVIGEQRFPSSDAMRCPYPLYERLQEEAPVTKLRHRDRDEFVVTQYEDIEHVTMHPEIFSNRHTVIEDGWVRSATLEHRQQTDYAWGLGNNDPPEHTQRRRLALEIFKPGRLRELEPMIRELVDDLIDDFGDRSRIEFVRDFAAPLPIRVILTLFGLPMDLEERTLGWSSYDGMGTPWNSHEIQAAARDGVSDLSQFLNQLVRDRVENPGDDDLSNHIQRSIEQHGGPDVPNLVAEATQFMLGGTVTTKHLLTNSVLLLLRNPELFERVRQNDDDLSKAIDESLRLESPVQFNPRLVLKDTEIGGVPIPKGAIVLLFWGAGNRDPRMFDHPDEMDLDRPNLRNHLAFGHGIHFCIGGPLARLEARIAFTALFAALSEIRLADEDVVVGPSVSFRAPKELHLGISR